MDNLQLVALLTVAFLAVTTFDQAQSVLHAGKQELMDTTPPLEDEPSSSPSSTTAPLTTTPPSSEEQERHVRQSDKVDKMDTTEPDRRLRKLKRPRPTTVSARLLTGSTRNMTFKTLGRLWAARDFAQIYSRIDYNQALLDYNHLVQQLDMAHERAISTRNFQGIALVVLNTTFIELHEQLGSAATALRFTCSLIKCKGEIQKSKVVLFSADQKETHESKNSLLHHSRKKRQAAAAAAAGAAVVAGLSIYTLEEVKALKQDLLAQRENENLIAERLTEHQTILHNLGTQMTELVTQLKSFHRWADKVEFKLGVTIVTAYLSRIIDKFERWSAAVNRIFIDQKFDPLFFSPDHISKALASIKDKAEKRGLHPLSTELVDLLKESVSFEAHEGFIFFAIHIPLGRGTPLNLYRWISTPLALADGSTVLIDIKDPLIAINPRLTERLELSEAKLSSCLKRGKNYLCNQGLTTKHVENSCLGSLFVGKLENLRALCKFSLLSKPHESVTQTGGNSVIVFSPPKTFTSIFITCTDRPKESKQIAARDHMTIDIPPDCVLSSPNYIFLPEKTYSISSVFVQRPLFEFTFNLTDIPFDRTLLQSFNTVVTPVNLPPLKLHSISSTQDHANLGLTILIAVILCITISALAYSLYKFGLFEQRQRAAKAPEAKLSDTDIPLSADGVPGAVGPDGPSSRDIKELRIRLLDNGQREVFPVPPGTGKSGEGAAASDDQREQQGLESDWDD